MNIKEIKDIITLMNENNLTEFEIEKEGFKLRLCKLPSGQIIVEKPVEQKQFIEPQTVSQSAPLPSQAAPSKKLIEIKSPMVGTFYRAPAPDAPPFVEVGDTIEIGTVVCILEAMKLMNEIKSEIKGKIVEIPVENAEPVEFGQVLFIVEPL